MSSKTAIAAVHRKIAANWAQLFSGSLVSSALTLLGFILMSRTISVESVGIIAVIQTYWRLIQGLLSFQSFQVLISFGAEALDSQNDTGFRKIVQTCAIADILVAALGTLGGIAVLLLFARRMSIPENFDTLALAGGLTMVSLVTGAPSGILRIFDRFYGVALRDVIAGGIRFVASAIGYFSNYPAEYFLAAWIAADVIGSLFLTAFGWMVFVKECFKRHPHAASHEPIPRRVLVRSLLAVSLVGILRITSEEGDVLLVNTFLGPVGAGKYRLAKNYAGVIHKVIGPLSAAIYPEIARLVANGNRSVFLRLFRDVNLGCGMIALFAMLAWAIFGKMILQFTVGAQYFDSYSTTLIFMIANMVAFFGICCDPTLLALKKWRGILIIAAVCTSAFFISAVILIPRFGIDGAASSQVVCYLVEVLMALWMIRRAGDWEFKMNELSPLTRT